MLAVPGVTGAFDARWMLSDSELSEEVLWVCVHVSVK